MAPISVHCPCCRVVTIHYCLYPLRGKFRCVDCWNFDESEYKIRYGLDLHSPLEPPIDYTYNVDVIIEGNLYCPKCKETGYHVLSRWGEAFIVLNVTMRLVMIMRGNFVARSFRERFSSALPVLLILCIVTSVGATGDMSQPMTMFFFATITFGRNAHE